jgi:nucleoside-diphosphate-sugar epimerase
LLVLGGTSLIGRFLLPRLAQAGRPFRAVSRAPRPPAEGGEWLVADLTRPPDLPPAAQAVSLSPIWLLPPALPALHAAGVRRLVAVSSTSRFTKALSPDPAERAVADDLARAEEAVQTYCEAHAIAWTILRPTLIYAEGEDANVTRLANLIRRFGVLPLYGAGEGRRQPVHADDLAAGALAALDNPAAENRAFDAPGGETLSYRAMAARIFLALGRRPRIISLPPALWRAGFALAAPLLPGAGAAMGERMNEDLVFDPGPAQAAFGWSPRPFRPVFSGSRQQAAGGR